MLTSVFIACVAALNPNPAWDDAWEDAESRFLSNHQQLTSEERFIKAGESYFSPDGRAVIFQGIERERPEIDPGQHYAMYFAAVRKADGRPSRLVGIQRLSEPGSSNTCGWFHPTAYKQGQSYPVLYGTTTTPPDDSKSAGYQRGTSRYTWQFPNEMEIVTQTVKRLSPRASAGQINKGWVVDDASPLWERAGYDAEASWSPDARHILYTRLDPGSDDGDIWVYDTETDTHTALLTASGYDGGPFFSPDGKSICYRSDRRGDKLLQVYVARLLFDDQGTIVGVEREIQITDNEHVNWAPFYTPDGAFLFYSTSEVSHGNYEVYCVDATGDDGPETRPTLRITHGRGFDGLPVFSPDGTTMMWTAQRGAMVEGESRPSSQLWAADLDLDAVRAAYEMLRMNMIQKIRSEDPDASFESYIPEGVKP